jgi:hypothetical protein
MRNLYSFYGAAMIVALLELTETGIAFSMRSVIASRM